MTPAHDLQTDEHHVLAGPIVVVGDALLDVDLLGSVVGVCPDAPAPIFNLARRLSRPGGAGLAAVLAAGDGPEVFLITGLCEDEYGDELAGLLCDRVKLIPLGCEGSTSVRTRLRAQDQSLVRLDQGEPGPITGLPMSVEPALRRASAILVSDHGRGLTRHPALRRLLAERARSTPLVWDPHPRGGRPVAGTWVATPNVAEVTAAIPDTAAVDALDAPDGANLLQGLPSGLPDGSLRVLAEQLNTLLHEWPTRALAVTRGESGAVLSDGSGVPFVIPAPLAPGRPIDTCGAGDRFASALTVALSEGRGLRDAVGHAVQMASDFVASGGAASIVDALPDTSDISAIAAGTVAPHGRLGAAAALARSVRARGGTVVATGGCFDRLHVGHVETLQRARQLGDCLIVALNSDESVRRLKGADRPIVVEADRIRMLEALNCVDAVVVFDEDTPVEVLRGLRPQVWCKGGDYGEESLPEQAVLEEWGGQVVALPYSTGQPTTSLATTITERGTPA